MKVIEIPEGYEARIEGNRVILEQNESEDERIRKEIIEFLDYGIWSETTIDKVKQSRRHAKWIAHLEKQKDPSNDEQFTRGYEAGKKDGLWERLLKAMGSHNNSVAFHNDYPPKMPDVPTYTTTNESSNVKDLKAEQKEQKPLSTEETELNSLAFLEQIGYTCIPPGKKQKPNDCIYGYEPSVERCKYCSARCNTRIDEQKPAEWSEEDKEELKYTVSVLERCGFSDSANWIKDLPNRFNLQPKQWWSEEDGLRLESCMAYLCNIRDVIEFSKQIGDNAKKSGKQEIQKNIDWLKFLSERLGHSQKSDNWKPSDEQMEALKYALGKGGAFSKEALEGLYEQLEKL